MPAMAHSIRTASVSSDQSPDAILHVVDVLTGLILRLARCLLGERMRCSEPLRQFVLIALKCGSNNVEARKNDGSEGKHQRMNSMIRSVEMIWRLLKVIVG